MIVVHGSHATFCSPQGTTTCHIYGTACASEGCSLVPGPLISQLPFGSKRCPCSHLRFRQSRHTSPRQAAAIITAVDGWNAAAPRTVPGVHLDSRHRRPMLGLNPACVPRVLAVSTGRLHPEVLIWGNRRQGRDQQSLLLATPTGI